MSVGRFVCLVMCPILAASCSSPLLPESDPQWVTRILEAEPPGFGDFSDALLRIHVNLFLGTDQEEYGGYDVYVTPRTTIADSRGGKTVRASASILEEGALVAVWHGILTTSAHAIAIERLE